MQADAEIVAAQVNSMIPRLCHCGEDEDLADDDTKSELSYASQEEEGEMAGASPASPATDQSSYRTPEVAPVRTLVEIPEESIVVDTPEEAVAVPLVRSGAVSPSSLAVTSTRATSPDPLMIPPPRAVTPPRPGSGPDHSVKHVRRLTPFAGRGLRLGGSCTSGVRSVHSPGFVVEGRRHPRPWRGRRIPSLAQYASQSGAFDRGYGRSTPESGLPARGEQSFGWGESG